VSDPALPPAVDATLRSLVGEARLREAAELAEANGAWHRATALYEQACDFASATRTAQRAGDSYRALSLSAIADDTSTFVRLLDDVPPERASPLAEDLAAKRLDRFAALAFARATRPLDAARAWEASGDARMAAESYERAGDVRNAARVLERRVSDAPESTKSLLALGALFVRHARHELALATLQKIPKNVREHDDAKPLLHTCFEALGLQAASQELVATTPNLESQKTVSHVGSAPRTEEAPLMFGRFRFVGDVARSGSARVVRAHDEVQRHDVAIKWLHTSSLVGSGRDAWSRFLREVKIQSEMKHPHVVPVLDFFPDAPAIVTPWMSGGSLEARVREAMAPSRAVEIVLAVLAALGDAHRLGVLHRDIKPANVLFDAVSTPHLCDFGVAQLGDGDNTITAAAVGSLAYMSPEQRQGRQASIQSDLFGVGVMLWELLTGALPTEGDTPGMLHGLHPSMASGHERAVRMLFAEDPGERPEDAFAAQRSLRAHTWPNELTQRSGTNAEATARQQSARLTPSPAGDLVDGWLSRQVSLIPFTEDTRASILAFAALRSPFVERVARVDEQERVAWFVAPPKDAARALAPSHRAPLARALATLHERGFAHGSIDRDHVLVTKDDVPVLLFPRQTVEARTIDADREALERLFTTAP